MLPCCWCCSSGTRCGPSTRCSIRGCSGWPAYAPGALGIVALFFALFRLFYINAQDLQDVKGYSALRTGVAVLPVAIVMPFTSARSTHLAAASPATCLGLRVGAVLLLVTTAVVAHQHPRDQES